MPQTGQTVQMTAHRPGFAKSLPVQILLLGITLTLTAVLIIHLIFTAQYHWPLAPVNCILQMSAVITLLVSCIATLHVVLSSTVTQSMRWPYMLDYIAVDIPPFDDTDSTSDWAMGELAAWLLMNATTSGLIQITHIQFLTLLFPSGLERRLIYILLGPLAIVASIMHVMRMHDDEKVVNVAFAVQNICNATLSLLFTSAIFLWGCVVNRRAAWRTDGGTAAFGVGALMLAIVSTALTFLYIQRRDQYAWMPNLMWSVVLWQSFVGWWWWVGAGMGVGELEELLRREEKRQEKRRAKMTRRKVRKERAQTFWNDVTHVFRNGGTRNTDEPAPPQRAEGEVEGSSSSESVVSGGESERERRRGRRGSEETVVEDSARSVVSRQTDASTRSGTTGYLPHFLSQYRAGRYVYGLYLGLRHAHLTAAREQAVERVERITQAYGPDAEEGTPPVFGWGLGSFGVRRQERRRTGQAEMEMDEFESEDDGGPKPWQHEDAPPIETGRGGGEGEDQGSRRRVTRKAIKEKRTARGLDNDSHRPSSMWWWGPLRRWRLQDSTDYRS
uniref:Heme-binding peroxidase (EC) n=1 Tax=Ganoderma boninense TaxID=34458 RepID=A0A5K1JUN6_9APHY|nr:Putative heme-binding peroxidase (EC [Ganoderma boninense]